MTKRITILGGGFAGVFAALGAAHEIRRLGQSGQVAIELVSSDAYLTIRPRLYEADLRGARVALRRLLAPLGVELLCGRATALDAARGLVDVLVGETKRSSRPFDALVLACGSVAHRPSAWESVHDVDSWQGALRLREHLQRGDGGASPDVLAGSAIVIGGGFTGLETATDLIGRLRHSPSVSAESVRVVLIERSEHVAPEYGPRARSHIEAALGELGIQCLPGSDVVDVGTDGTVTLANGGELRAGTIVWTGGLRARELESDLSAGMNAAGRLAVDRTLGVPGAENVFAAGDMAAAEVHSGQPAPMSCQHAMPQGRVAGHNAVRSLLGLELIAYQQPLYITCLDLGGAGALLTCGFERDDVLATGAEAKAVKRMINRGAIYPPLDGDPAALTAAGRMEPAASGAGAMDDEQWARALLRLAASGGVPDRAAQVEEAQPRLNNAGGVRA